MYSHLKLLQRHIAPSRVRIDDIGLRYRKVVEQVREHLFEFIITHYVDVRNILDKLKR